MKWVARATISLAGFLILAIGGVLFFPASSFVPDPRVLYDETQFDLHEKVGWYELEDGSLRLLTWGAERGLALYGFGMNRADLRQTVFYPVTADSMVSAHNPDESRLEFVTGGDGMISEASLTTPSGMQSMIPVAGPYQTREVRFSNGEVQLSGLLFIPPGSGPHPAVVFIHGSGTSSRGGFWYLTPADYLAREGVMVLLPDKRGSGKSGGEWHTSSFEDYAEDALAAVTFLTGEEAVDSTKVGLVGFSQGGWVAPLAATRSPDVDFVVTVSASGAKPSEQVAYEVSREIANAGAPAFLAKALAPLFSRRAKMSQEQWWQLNGSFDPVPYWQEMGSPSLLLFGAADQNVDVPRTLAILEGEGLTGQDKLSTKVFPDLGHGLIREDTGWIEPEFLSMMGQFVLGQ